MVRFIYNKEKITCMDKKGFIRTLEAVIAILIVFVFIYVLMQDSLTSKSKTSDSIKSMEEEILRGISESESDIDTDSIKVVTKRSCIVALTSDIDFSKNYGNLNDVDKNCVNAIKKYVEDSLPVKFKQNYALTICGTNCGIPSTLPDKEVYTTAIIITSFLSTEQDYNPKIVRLWVW